jgi:hypothetical protein
MYCLVRACRKAFTFTVSSSNLNYIFRVSNGAMSNVDTNHQVIKPTATIELLRIVDENLWSGIHTQLTDNGGVYKVVALRNGNRMPVNRFLGTDTNGILYIGKATSIVDRVIDLKKSIVPAYKGTGHICGRRYKANPNIAAKFPIDTLHLELLPSDEPERLEQVLLNEYRSIFGEVPPLNAL